MIDNSLKYGPILIYISDFSKTFLLEGSKDKHRAMATFLPFMLMESYHSYHISHHITHPYILIQQCWGGGELPFYMCSAQDVAHCPRHRIHGNKSDNKSITAIYASYVLIHFPLPNYQR